VEKEGMKKTKVVTPSDRISVRDVAAAAGVSIGSVSRVLNGGTYVSADLSSRVLRAVEQLGYHPNANARGLRMGTSKTIGCLIPDISNPLYASYVSGIEARMQEDGYMLLFGSTRSLVSRERELIKLFESRGMDGIIATTVNEGPGESAEAFAKCKIPVVIIDRDMGENYDVVLLDHRGAIRHAVDYLFSLGHERILLLTPGASIRPGRERIAGYKEAYRDANRAFDPSLIRTVNPRLGSSYDDMKQLLSSPNKPTAVIGLSTHVLSDATRAIYEHGLSIPKDISVIGIGTSESVGFSNPPMTILRIDVDVNARTAAELLLERIQVGPDGGRRRITKPIDLVLAGSCARCISS
jgi:LacI family transcriptional regulator